MRRAPKERFPDLDKEERKNVAVLEERRKYLTGRLEAQDCSDRARPYLRDERDALDWVLSEVTACRSMVTL